MKNSTILIILDGYGIAPAGAGNAIAQAQTPVMDRLMRECPNTLLAASGEDVGLPAGQMGNSEVGHTNIGAGRVVYQELSRITRAAQAGELQENPALIAAVEHCRKTGGALHLMGLLSDGGVHSHNSHLYAMLRAVKELGAKQVYIHAFTDGRDCPPRSGEGFVADLLRELEANGTGQLATLCGRYYAMDRDNRWDRVEQAYHALIQPADQWAEPLAYIRSCYAQDKTDEFIPPAACCPGGRIADGDSVVCFNFRPDRAREITRALMQPDFSGFARHRAENLCYVCTTVYDDGFAAYPGLTVAFPPERPEQTLGEIVAAEGLSQLRIAETEKYAHVTFFFSGGREEPFEGEERVLVPSPEVATYDLQPEMSAPEVTRRVVAAIQSKNYALIVLNFANCDMVGHTGSIPAAIRAVERVDACLGEVLQAAVQAGMTALVTADHGNADEMLDEAGGPKTAHTTNPVPLVLVGSQAALRAGGRLADIAPTILELMGLPCPSAMTGKSLIHPNEKGNLYQKMPQIQK